MKRKLRQKGGFTIGEMLVAIALMGMMGVALIAGTGAAVRVYRGINDASEAELLLSTMTTAVTDELRFATDVTTVTDSEGATTIQFTSQTYGTESSLTSPDGRLQIKGHNLLSDQTYTSLHGFLDSITYADGVFTVKLSVKASTDADAAVLADTGEAGVSVQAVNIAPTGSGVT